MCKAEDKKCKATKESSQSEENEQIIKKRSVPMVILRWPNVQKAIKSKKKQEENKNSKNMIGSSEIGDAQNE